MSGVREQAQESFERNVAAEHQMEVIRDDGEYRHLRFAKPGTWIYGFDLVTWPGYLMSVGDVADGYCFSGLHGIDRMEFFGKKSGFDPHYWSSKVQASRWPVRQYSEDRFHACAGRYFTEDYSGLPSSENQRRKALWKEHLLGYELASKDLAITAAMEFKVDGHWPMAEFYEHDLEEFDFHFLLACYCINWGARTYLDSARVSGSGKENE